MERVLWNGLARRSLSYAYHSLLLAFHADYRGEYGYQLIRCRTVGPCIYSSFPGTYRVFTIGRTHHTRAGNTIGSGLDIAHFRELVHGHGIISSRPNHGYGELQKREKPLGVTTFSAWTPCRRKIYLEA